PPVVPLAGGVPPDGEVGGAIAPPRPSSLGIVVGPIPMPAPPGSAGVPPAPGLGALEALAALSGDEESPASEQAMANSATASMAEDGDRLRAPAIRIEDARMSVRVVYFMLGDSFGVSVLSSRPPRHPPG